MTMGKRLLGGMLGLFVLAFSGAAHAATSIDSISFKFAPDQGYYLTTEQTQTLGKWGYAFGLETEYTKGSIVAVNAAGVRIRDVIDGQIDMQLGAALGLCDWLNVGLNVSMVPYQQFNTVATGAADNGARMGDMRLSFKARIVDPTRYPVGLAIVPFMTIPTGNDAHFVGEGNVTGGGVLALETPRIANRFSAVLNVGAQASPSANLSSGTSVGSRFLVGTAFNVAVIKPVQLIAELTGWTPFSHFWEQNSRNLEVNGAVRVIPTKGLAVTAGGGSGLLKAIGAPDYRVFAAVSYRKEKHEKAAAPVAEVVIRTNKIHFEFDRARIRPESEPILDQIAQTIKDQPKVKHVTIEGHTDGLGGEKYNQKLSERRAQSVMQYLVKKGIAPEMLTAVGKGKSEPIADNKTKQGRAQNRRIEFHLEFGEGTGVRVEEDTDSPVFTGK